ncbi:MAG: hypothetical protein Q8881_02885 [Sweet potato little leaf phytoplasma]|nr:hypothetical protein [Sweet potato little leaf phytoplasma]
MPRNGRISAQFRTRGRFRRNGRINPAKFPPNFPLGDVSDETAESIPPNFTLEDFFDETAEFSPNFALGDVSPEIAEFLPNFALVVVSDETTEFSPISHSGTFLTNFALGTFPRNG